MDALSSHDGTRLFLALGVLLFAARGAGELARRLGQPSVLGEIAAGVVLGPTVLGRLAPSWSEHLFPERGPVAVAFQGLTALAVTLFLLAAGLEVDLSAALRRGRSVLAVAIGGIAAPFALGYAAVAVAPTWLGAGDSAHPELFPLFLATALSISALPVIAKTLMDLHLHRSDLGAIVIGAAVLNDLVGWLCFAGVLAAVSSGPGVPAPSTTIALTLGFTAGMLTVGRWLVHASLPWIMARTSGSGGVLAFSLSLGLLCAAFTAFAGVHSLFGAFLAGVALGDSAHLSERARATIRDFVGHFFAPLFFGSIGLTVDFASQFDLGLCAAVLCVACVGKVLGCALAARWSGTRGREAWAVGFAMNARGSMEIVLGLVALQVGLIGERLFVALVVMALATSLMSAPLLQRLTRRARPRRLVELLTPGSFLPDLRARDRDAAIAELASALAPRARVPAEQLTELVLARERAGPTGIGDGVAIPHARVASLAEPLLALGLSRAGLDFDSVDGQPARVVLLVLTPPSAEAGTTHTQLGILAAAGEALSDAARRERVLRARTWAELASALNGS